MTPAEQIRAVLDAFRRGYEQAEAEHADKVWLTRDEAKALQQFAFEVRMWIKTEQDNERALGFVALLDERLGGAR